MKRLISLLALAALSVCLLAGCSQQNSTDATDISGELNYESSMELTSATGFSVDYYTDGYKLISIEDEGQFLVVPEGKEAPSDLDDGITVIQQPLQNIYLVASATMDMFRAIDGLDAIKLTGTKQSDWYIEEAVQAMEDGRIIYAGKYSMPDYELILQEGCDLAIQSTMIYHSPDVKEALEGYGIPVLVDQSSYEEEPLGRSEWIKLYGALLNKEDAAEAAFNEQKELFEQVAAADALQSSPSVAFFYVNSNGAVNVRRGDDYVAKIIEMAGGTYVFSDLVDEDTNSSSKTIQMEEFYSKAKDADILIYNSTIEGDISTLDELTAKSSFLGNFKAVKAGNVWCTTQSMYQDSMELGDLISDVHAVLENPNISDDQLKYLYRIK